MTLQCEQASTGFVDQREAVEGPAHEVVFHLPQPANFKGNMPSYSISSGGHARRPWSCNCLGGAWHVFARQLIAAVQHVFQAQLSCADVRFAVDEKSLLNVVVVSPFSRVNCLSIQQNSSVRLAIRASLGQTLCTPHCSNTSRASTSLRDSATMSHTSSFLPRATGSPSHRLAPSTRVKASADLLSQL